MKIAVTGGSGQLGTLVLQRLAADQHVSEIVSIDLKPPRVASAKLKPVISDVRDSKIGRHFEGCDAVIHLAFIVTGAPARLVMDAINVGGSRNVFEAAASAGVPRIIYSSSIAAYGVVPGHPVPITEDTTRRHQPSFAYSATKYEVEAFLDSFERAHPEIAIARLRPAILIGSMMNHGFGDMLRRGLMIELGPNPLPIVWDEDVADAIVLALRNNAHGAFNLASESALPTKDLAKAAGFRSIYLPETLLGRLVRATQPLARMGLARETDPAWVEHLGVRMIVSSEKARNELGWRPKYLSAQQVMRHYREVTGSKTDWRLLAFFKLVEFASRRMDLTPHRERIASHVHLELTGDGGGDFGLSFDGGHLVIENQWPSTPNAVVTMELNTFRDLLAGRMDFAAAQRVGKVQIDGEAPAALVVREIVSRFQKQVPNTGVAAWPAQRMAQWLAEPASA